MHMIYLKYLLYLTSITEGEPSKTKLFCLRSSISPRARSSRAEAVPIVYLCLSYLYSFPRGEKAPRPCGSQWLNHATLNGISKLASPEISTKPRRLYGKHLLDNEFSLYLLSSLELLCPPQIC